MYVCMHVCMYVCIGGLFGFANCCAVMSGTRTSHCEVCQCIDSVSRQDQTIGLAKGDPVHTRRWHLSMSVLSWSVLFAAVWTRLTCHRTGNLLSPSADGAFEGNSRTGAGGTAAEYSAALGFVHTSRQRLKWN